MTASDQTDKLSLSDEPYPKLTPAELDEVLARFYQCLAYTATTWNR